jgi:hypothetical protein
LSRNRDRSLKMLEDDSAFDASLPSKFDVLLRNTDDYIIYWYFD